MLAILPIATFRMRGAHWRTKVQEMWDLLLADTGSSVYCPGLSDRANSEHGEKNNAHFCH
jgi:hypothetical protein